MFSFGSKKPHRRRDAKSGEARRPRLERRDALKNIEYEASWTSASSDESASLHASRSLDFSPSNYSNQSSFRIGGSIEGEVEHLYKSLGLSGPEDFAIPLAAWEASIKVRSSSDVNRGVEAEEVVVVEDEAAVGDCVSRSGVKGMRPPVLIAPPLVSVLLPLPPSRAVAVQDGVSSSWEIVKSFAPDDEGEVVDVRRAVESDEGLEGGNSDGGVSVDVDDDSSSTTTEIVISPNGRFKKRIRSWMRGDQLGSGSFGTVYEGISDDGTFIAVKEVSLLDKGKNGEQCILQLEQEIALLSQFEHENIVQYYGTDKEDSKLYIFLELVTQGSIASLYQKYHLRETQVSSYTRQILNGLNYLHERDVVHRDIKCANILVHANGSIKLADFGLAKEISRFNDLKSCKGSVYWMAPEVINPKKTYGRAADIWSLGCTVLEMLTRQIPYPNVEWQHAFYRIGRGDQPPIPGHLSRDAQDFIAKCVLVDPSCRPTAAQLLSHPFVTRRPLQTY